MYLCFGTLLKILNLCRKNINQAPFVSKFILLIDPFNSCTRYADASNHFSGDEHVISKLLSCTINFTPANRTQVAKSSSDEIIADFSSKISPFIGEFYKPKIIFSLLEIIDSDTSIDTENKYTFKEYFGVEKQELLHQDEYDFCDLISRALLYTACTSITNKNGKSHINSITPDWMNKIYKRYSNQIHWNDHLQVLTLPFLKMFNCFTDKLHIHQIDFFIEKKDPAGPTEDFWLDRCESFICDINNNLLIPFGSIDNLSESTTFIKIQEFTQTFNDYTDYIGKNVIPIYKTFNAKDSSTYFDNLSSAGISADLISSDIYELVASFNDDNTISNINSTHHTKDEYIHFDQTGFFIPKFRNIKDELSFSECINNYRHRLCLLYKER